MNTPKKTSSWLAVAAVLALGAALGWAVLQKGPSQAGGEHAHGDHADEKDHADEQAPSDKGPHGGRLFQAGATRFELVIFETGVPPEFRLYATQDGKPVAPGGLTATVTLERLGRAPQLIRFQPQGDFLRGDAEVSEPHSFKVTLAAVQGGQTHRFAYEQEEARVTMSDAQLQQAGVTFAVAGPARIQSQLELLGEVRYNGDRTVQVVPRVAGLVEAVEVSAGARVRKGQVLAVLSSPALADQRAEALAAQRRLALARSTHDREKQLWQDKISPEQDYLQARAALQEAEIAEQAIRQKLANLGVQPGGSGALTRFALRSPIDGIVTEQRITVGQSLAENEAVFTVSDLSSVWVELPVATQDLAAVRPGQPVQVKAAGIEGQASGTIAHVSAMVGEQSRSATARVVLANPKGLWRPGLPVSVAVSAGEAEVPVAVEAAAIQGLRDWQVVFGRYGQQLEARPLTLGRSDGRLVEVREGLNAGERYAVGNSFVIKAELGKAGASHDH
ncbi:efflux RND transporter periplasmic adaptor subunit [Aquabacterium sp.]|uniref:efflux RND transporter periplasmic adaptor subunit n=1 Tax=Aquabacterium sp. TaxID=1872578 RepID=UPI0025C6D4F8|nr:efflux RND transporter periplasmic adaptor subunit [Aquabacterium sp.]